MRELLAHPVQLAYVDSVQMHDNKARNRKLSAKTPKRGASGNDRGIGRRRSPEHEFASSSESASVNVVDLTNGARFRSIPVPDGDVRDSLKYAANYTSHRQPQRSYEMVQNQHRSKRKKNIHAE